MRNYYLRGAQSEECTRCGRIADCESTESGSGFSSPSRLESRSPRTFTLFFSWRWGTCDLEGGPPRCHWWRQECPMYPVCSCLTVIRSLNAFTIELAPELMVTGVLRHPFPPPLYVASRSFTCRKRKRGTLTHSLSHSLLHTLT